jgi:flavin-dependent dehydrogenase
MKTRDAVIIGGGLAGAAAAARLAQQGIDVLLLEKETQPHHKVCGEFISYETQHYFSELGLDLAACGAQPIERLRLIRKDKTIDVPLGFQAMSLSRKVLDEAVLATARMRGAEIKYGAAVTGLAKEISGWRIDGNECGPIIAKTVFLATGKHDLRGWSRREGKQNDYIGFKMYFSLTPSQQALMANHIEIMLFDGGYAGIEPVEGGLANLCLVVTKTQFNVWGKNWDALLQKLMQTIPALAAYLTGATPCWDKPLAIFGIPYGFVYRASPQDSDNLFRLGDQMAVIPSLCGDGMAIAVHTGFLAAECYAKTGARDYHRRARQQLAGQIGLATVMARLLSSPLFQPLALPICRALPKIIPTIIRHTRTSGDFN